MQFSRDAGGHEALGVRDVLVQEQVEGPDHEVGGWEIR